MANLILTNYCNAGCSFCFAADSRSRMLRNGLQQMNEAEVRDWLEFTLAAGIRELRLLGGEPTLHPQFADFVQLGVEKGCQITVFSNGVMPEKSLQILAKLPQEICTVVINLNAAIRREDELRRCETLAILGPRTLPGMTLTSPDFTFEPVVEAIETFGLQRNIRIGLAHPAWGGSNRRVHPKRYPVIGEALLEGSFLTSRHGISLDADCGFVRCMFGDQFRTLCENGFRYHSSCTPVLDLCTGGMILPCFGLSGLLTLKRADYPDAGAAYSKMNELLAPWHAFGIYPECADCRYFESEACCGGCLSARLCRIQPLEDEQ